MRSRSLSACLAIPLLATALVACDGLAGRPTKVASGELYQSGEASYDDYFKKVHEQQVAAAGWSDESKAARAPLVKALDLAPTASNSTILSAAKKRKDDAAVKAAAEDTASAERAFAKKQNALAEGLDLLAEEGAKLRKQAIDDRRNMGADKADPEKVEKKEELKREVAAAADVASDLRSDARKGAKEAEDLADALKRELGVAVAGANAGHGVDDAAAFGAEAGAEAGLETRAEAHRGSLQPLSGGRRWRPARTCYITRAKDAAETRQPIGILEPMAPCSHVLHNACERGRRTAATERNPWAEKASLARVT